MPRTQKWADAHPRVSFYADSPEEVAKLEEEAVQNGLSLGHYVALLVSNRRAVQQVVERAKGTPPGYGVRCYGCQTLLPTVYIESQMKLQRDLAEPEEPADEDVTEEAAATA